MNMRRWIQHSLSLGTLALVASATTVAAQWNSRSPRTSREQELFEWRGRVDREVQIVMRGNRLWTNDIGRTETNDERSRTYATLPRQDGEVVVRTENGRGRVDVIQQPDARNGYTAIVRVMDPASGSDTYRLVAYWDAYANGDIYRGGRANDRSHGQRGDEMGNRSRDRDDDWDRNRNNRLSAMRWSGNVDNELEIRIQNGRVEYRTLSGNQPTSIRVNATNTSAPRNGMQLAVAENSGRGAVTLVQQPNQWNGYTTVIRVRDPQGGYGFYDFDLVWQ
jgi:hypothetical protein